VRATAAGDVLFQEGDRSYDFFVILAGRVMVVDGYGDAQRDLAEGGPGDFVAELNMFTGERLYTTAIVSQAGSVLAVPAASIVALIGSDPDLGDVIIPAVFARRQWLTQHRAGMRIVGSKFSPDTARLREFAARNLPAHVWIDPDTDRSGQHLLDAAGLDASATPVVFLAGGDVLVKPTNAEMAQSAGLVTAPEPSAIYDLVVVGAGPAGLAASVYASSEGLRVAALDAVGVGGQISTTTRFENYLGFPVGVSGEEFASRAQLQARRFGTRMIVPGRATALNTRNGFLVVSLEDSDEVVARSVIVASGIEYRRLAIPGIERLEGISVFYSPLDAQDRVGEGDPVVVIGGGNSAGQAATALAASGHHVTLVVRGNDLSTSMVRYLTERIADDHRIEVLTDAEVGHLEGDTTLSAVSIQEHGAGGQRHVTATAMFVLIGAAPYSGWLGDAVKVDDTGYILTGSSLGTDINQAEAWRTLGRAPFPLETSVPGVFAAGDIRADSLKRVGSAVGDGSLAARLVHEWLGKPSIPAPFSGRASSSAT
jgi:thioredoxin reductase (NADPH)